VICSPYLPLLAALYKLEIEQSNWPLAFQSLLRVPFLLDMPVDS
jgi:hypothetical protein